MSASGDVPPQQRRATDQGKGQEKGKGKCAPLSVDTFAKGKGKGKAPPAPATLSRPNPAHFTEFEIQIERDRAAPLDLSIWCVLDRSVGVGCKFGSGLTKEIMALLPHQPVSLWNDAQPPPDRVRIGDVLVAVDGIQVTTLASWKDAINTRSTTCTLTIRRMHEKQRVVTLMRQGDVIVGRTLSGAEAFSLDESAAAATANHLRQQVATALGVPLNTLVLFDGASRLADSDAVSGLDFILVKQHDKGVKWSWAPACGCGESSEKAEALPVDSTPLCFQTARDVAAKLDFEGLASDMAETWQSSMRFENSSEWYGWQKTGEGQWSYSSLDAFDQGPKEPADAVDVDTTPLPPFAIARARLLPVFDVRCDSAAPTMECCPSDVLAEELLVEAAAWLRVATLSSQGLQGLEALMLQGCIEPSCAATATCDLLEALTRAGRATDAFLVAECILLQSWQCRDAAGCRAVDDFIGRKLQMSKRQELRRNLGSRSSGVVVKELPLGKDLPMSSSDIRDMRRASMRTLAGLASAGHADSLRAIVDLIQQPGQCVADDVAHVASALIGAIPDDHEALIPALIKLTQSAASGYAALRRLCVLDWAAEETAVIRAVRDVLLQLAPAPRSFCVTTEFGENWMSDPMIVAWATDLDSTIDNLLSSLPIEMVDQYGSALTSGPLDTSDSLHVKVASLSASIDKSQAVGSWEHLAPLLLVLLRRFSAVPVLLGDEDVIASFCHRSKVGFAASRALALEALMLVAPSRRNQLLGIACENAVAEDAVVRTQALDLLQTLATPEDMATIRSRIAAGKSPHGKAILKLLEDSVAARAVVNEGSTLCAL